jgi:hypothetical protein
VPYLIVVVAGLILGLVVGRWWTLLAAAGVGVWIALITGVDEMSPWFLGAIYGTLSAFAIAIGILVRKRMRHSRLP